MSSSQDRPTGNRSQLHQTKPNQTLLGMVDDVLSISDCGYKTRRMNAFLNAKTAVKRLQLGPDKCHVMHVGKNIPEYKKDTLYVDGWEMKEIQNKSTGEVEVQETLQGNSIISENINEKYLGQIISSDASNVANVTSRTRKGTGMTHTIESIMKNVPGGRFHFEIAVILRNAYLISSMLSCSEVWYNINEHELRKLEQVDEKLLLMILNCSSQVTHETLYLELGLMPIRFIIKLRRIIYFQHILHQKPNNFLIYNFLLAQIEEPKRNDWASTVKADLEELNIDSSISEIEAMKSETYKTICKEKIKKKAFEYLENRKSEHEKVRHIKYEKLEMAGYLKSNDLDLSVRERQFLFQCRMSDIDLRANRTWKYKDIYCIACKDENILENGYHTLECKVLCNKSNDIRYIPRYMDLFSADIEEQVYVSKILHSNMEARKAFLKE